MVDKENVCKACEHTHDLKGCASKHVGEARKFLAEGDSDGADLSLSNFEKHLKSE